MEDAEPPNTVPHLNKQEEYHRLLLMTTCKLETRLSLLIYPHSMCVEIVLFCTTTLEKKVCACSSSNSTTYNYYVYYVYACKSTRILEVIKKLCIQSLTHVSSDIQTAYFIRIRKSNNSTSYNIQKLSVIVTEDW